MAKARMQFNKLNHATTKTERDEIEVEYGIKPRLIGNDINMNNSRESVLYSCVLSLCRWINLTLRRKITLTDILTAEKLWGKWHL